MKSTRSSFSAPVSRSVSSAVSSPSMASRSSRSLFPRSFLIHDLVSVIELIRIRFSDFNLYYDDRISKSDEISACII